MTGRPWTPVVAPALAWSAQGLLGWWISGQACNNGTAAWGPLSAGGVRALLIAVGAVALLVAVASTLSARGRTTSRTTGGTLAAIEVEEPARFAAVAGMLVGIAFSLGITWALIANAALPVCELSR